MAKKLPPIQYSPDRNLSLVPGVSPFNPNEIWWTLHVKSPVSGHWVSVQGGVSSYWMRELGFNPSAQAAA